MRTVLWMSIGFAALACTDAVEIVVVDEDPPLEDSDTAVSTMHQSPSETDTSGSPVDTADDPVTSDRIESTSRETLIGGWTLDSAAPETYEFRDDGRFVWSGDNWNLSSNIKRVEGTWMLAGRELQLTATLEDIGSGLPTRTEKQFTIAVVDDFLYLDVFIRTAGNDGTPFSGTWKKTRRIESGDIIEDKMMTVAPKDGYCAVSVYDYNSQNVLYNTRIIQDLMPFRTEGEVAYWMISDSISHSWRFSYEQTSPVGVELVFGVKVASHVIASARHSRQEADDHAFKRSGHIQHPL